MFYFAIPLSSGVLPTFSTVTDATVEVCFAPEEDCAAFAERAIEAAEREILVSAYQLTVGSGVVGALIRAKERAVDVRVIADRGRAMRTRQRDLPSGRSASAGVD